MFSEKRLYSGKESNSDWTERLKVSSTGPISLCALLVRFRSLAFPADPKGPPEVACLQDM